MSACPVPPPKNLAHCRIPNSYFDKYLDELVGARLYAFGLIICETIGRSEIWAAISDEDFAHTTNVGKEVYRAAVQHLINSGLIQHKVERGRDCYRVAEPIADETSNAKKRRNLPGQCDQCKKVTTFERGYTSVPHCFFRHLPACLDPASFVCLAVIVRETLRWLPGYGFNPQFSEIDQQHFTDLTGLADKSISNALAKLCDAEGWNLVERIERRGRPSLYRANWQQVCLLRTGGTFEKPDTSPKRG